MSSEKITTKRERKSQKPAAQKQPEITEKLKVLALHGYRQNGDSFKSKIGSFRKMVSRYADITFITAPHIAPPMEPEETEKEDQRSWWFNKDDGTFKGTNKCGPAIGFEKSVNLVESVWKNEGPFQGLLGFSQGACFVGLLCDLSSRGMTCVKPDFAICSSGFKSGSLAHLNYYTHPVEIPSLQIYGETDNIIPKEMSEDLARTFADLQVLTHPGGHYFPATVKEKQTYVNFFQDRLQEYLEKKEIENSNSTNSELLEDDEGSSSSN